MEPDARPSHLRMDTRLHPAVRACRAAAKDPDAPGDDQRDIPQLRSTRMQISRRTLGFAVLAAAIGGSVGRGPARAQITPLSHDQGATGLALALRHLPNDGAVLMVTAHPDDENNGLLVKLSRGLGIKTSLLTVTRGDGGQNEIGPELFQGIGILRAEELAGVHRYDNADQYFTRAYEFGYSFSVEETSEKWGKEPILVDVVKVSRMTPPA